MDAETILLAKKFSGGADVSAAKAYKEAAQAAATQAVNAAASVPNNVSSTLQTLTQDMAALEAQMQNIETSGISISGNEGDVVRVGQNGAVYAGDRPITRLMEAMVPEDVTHEDSGITWIANDNDEVCGFVINEDTSGKTINSYNHDKYLLTVTNVVNGITDNKITSRTVILDTDYVNGPAQDRNNRSGYMYYTIPYQDVCQIAVTIGINAAGCAYTELDYGNSPVMRQYFPAGAVVGMGKRYQKDMGTDHVNAISFISLDDTLKYGTMIRLWKA